MRSRLAASMVGPSWGNPAASRSSIRRAVRHLPRDEAAAELERTFPERLARRVAAFRAAHPNADAHLALLPMGEGIKLLPSLQGEVRA